MGYSTPQMVRFAIVATPDGQQPTASSGTAADLSDSQLNDAIAEADAMIDTFLGSIYTTPVAAVNGQTPHPIDFWSRNIAAYNATLAYRQNLDFTETDPIARRYADTMAAIKQVAAGTITLGLPLDTTGSQREIVGGPVNPYTGNLWDSNAWDLRPGDRLIGGGVYQPYFPLPPY